MSEPSVAPEHAQNFAQGSPFWRFSLAFYGPDSAPACLVLQDTCGVDVNVMLYLLWRASQGDALDQSAIIELEALVTPWRDHVVKPLREVRRWMKIAGAAEQGQLNTALRSAIKKNELSAEKHQQEILFANTDRVPGTVEAPDVAASLNLEAYAVFLGVTFQNAEVGALITRLHKILPDAPW